MLQDIWYETIDDFRNGDIGNGLLGLFLLLMLLLVFALIAGVIFWAVDSCGTSEQLGTGTIQSYRFEPEHTQPIVTTTGDVTTVTMVHYDDAWYTTIKLDNSDLTDEVQITHGYYESISDNMPVKIKYSEGRISNWMYITDIINEN